MLCPILNGQITIRLTELLKLLFFLFAILLFLSYIQLSCTALGIISNTIFPILVVLLVLLCLGNKVSLF